MVFPKSHPFMHSHLVKVLLVEDDEDDYVITRSFLEEIEGKAFALEWVTTYEEALECIARQQHDVYLVDYRLGRYTGLDLLREAVRLDCNAPIILLTGQGDREVDVAAMQAGAADYLIKGETDAPMLERAIRYAIAHNRTLQTLRQTLHDKSLLSTAIANLSTGLVITDPKLPDNPVIFANPGFTRITGYEIDEVLGHNCRFLQGKETELEARQALQQAIVNRESITCTLLNYRKDGTSFWNELTIGPVFDADGHLTHFIGLQNDVTAREKTRQKLEQLRHLHELILNSAGEGIYGLDMAGNTTFINPAAARMLGWEIDELIGKPIEVILPLHQDQGAQWQPDELAQTARQPGNLHHVDHAMFRRKDGTSFPVEYISTPILENGQQVGAVVTFQDITERKRSEEALRESEERYALAVEGANDGIWDWNLKTGEVYYSPRWKAMLGYAETEIGNSLDEWFNHIHPEDRPWVKTRIDAHIQGVTAYLESEHRMLRREGEYCWMLNRGVAVRDATGEVTRIAGSQTDITDRKQAEARLLHNALYDVLTNLPNRALLNDRLRHAIHVAKRNEHYLFAILFLDLDRFKVINDSLGHLIGDQLLVSFAQRLNACIRPGDTLARLGGDEFVILLEDIKDLYSATLVADRIQQELAQPFKLGGHEVFTTASLGIALSSMGYDSPDDLIRDADTAMYRAKAAGKARYEIFNSSMHIRAVELLQMETDLRRAISMHHVDPQGKSHDFRIGNLREMQEFQLHYQPIISLNHQQIVGFEALIRWNHPQRGMIPPSEFVPIAEETGLILPLGTWAIWEACRQMQIWQQQYPNNPPLTISVNLSGRQLTLNLIDQICQILHATGLSANQLKLEITESVLMESAESAVSILLQLQRLGIQLAIDDFGVGYSSLSYLHRFPINTLKIDRSFISKIDQDGEQLAIVRTIITLAWNLGMDVTAEGIETPKQLAQLKALQCGFGQGYLFSQPLPAAVLNEKLAVFNVHPNIGK